MKKLSSVNVLGKKIKIIYTDMEDWGECFTDQKEIYLSTNCLENSEVHWWTLVHEVTHMIFEMSGVAFMEQNDEEAYVRCVENLVLPWVLEHQHLKK
jgi:hypothetical protein